ncbi:MAG: adenosylcobinamide-phosphate synthase CbiB [Clostridia bacterium]
MQLTIAIVCGFILDLIIGDPQWFPHPVRFFGWLIAGGEKLVRRIFPKSPKGEYWGGVFLVIVLSYLCLSLVLVLIALAAAWHAYALFALQVLLSYLFVATKNLQVESMYVYQELSKNDLTRARYYLSRIVGRDTERLNEEQIAKGAVETVAENTADGVIAPLLFLILGGLPWCVLYKMVNTLDSMIGYKNKKYLYFGRFAALMDDALSYLPARLSAGFMLLSTALLGMNAKAAAKIYWRDKAKHASPNSGQTEAVMAGALNITLGGNNYYGGKLVTKPTIGDGKRLVEKEDIVKANRLMLLTAILFLLVGVAVRVVFKLA